MSRDSHEFVNKMMLVAVRIRERSGRMKWFTACGMCIVGLDWRAHVREDAFVGLFLWHALSYEADVASMPWSRWQGEVSDDVDVS